MFFQRGPDAAMRSFATRAAASNIRGGELRWRSRADPVKRRQRTPSCNHSKTSVMMRRPWAP